MEGIEREQERRYRERGKRNILKGRERDNERKRERERERERERVCLRLFSKQVICHPSYDFSFPIFHFHQNLKNKLFSCFYCCCRLNEEVGQFPVL
jgi:hypothetical protein